MHLNLETIKLGRGKHSADSGQACVMECVACLAGEEFTDMPKCASPVIASFMRSWNDQMDDESRQILKPLIPVVMNTATTRADELTRSWMAMDWMIRAYVPSWLDLAGLTKQAEALRQGAVITDGVLLAEALPSLMTARDSASAARDAAWDAAWAAAGDAAWAAAGDAAGDALRPTVASLQSSALDLIRRMSQVGR